MDYVLLIVIGFCISMLSGFFGIGGGFVLTPLLLLLGFSPIEAITTSLFYTIGSSIAGMYAHYKLKNILWKEAIIVGISGAIATQVAYPFVRWLESNNLDTTVIPTFYLILLTYFSYSMLKKQKNVTSKTSVGASKWKLIILGIGAGFLSTTLGVGGGFFLVPLLITFFGLPSKKAVATSLVAVFFIVSTGFVTYVVNTPIQWEVAFFLVTGALLGSPLGAKATSFFQQKRIQHLLGFLYITTFISLALKLIQLNTVGFWILSIYTLFVNVLLLVRLFKQKRLAAIT
ncbi:sulfite exporter TauE/SafE family protein [Sutcliffiella cohnii]|uniref:Probable membrane transporter protein n=1 Tax=Sutcliffiella cohnii TaxID=33932 RepID=A0A223KLH6_9BACI|nr:sulfite exporter TauE/SafE family protein [Sutcliffiella cohnii]AST90359.1 permease [Sutcliffiella cohnii]MED4017536.1 sulfite exporter TauE/SafE family protein [Sutcliffiella cohnii]